MYGDGATKCTYESTGLVHDVRARWGCSVSVGVFVRIGGDPAGNLGNWPNLPPFALPGVENPTIGRRVPEVLFLIVYFVIKSLNIF